jgi:hypothetical protein
LALTALSLLFLVLNLSHPDVHIFDYWLENTLISLVFSTIGAVIASRRPENSIGWLFCVVGLLGGIRHFTSQYVIYTLLADPGSLVGGEVLAWVTFWLWVPHLGLMVFLPLLFPDGRLPSRRWRWVAWCIGFVILSGTVSAAFSSVPLFAGLGQIQNPLGIEEADGTSWLALTLSGILVLWGVLLLVATASTFARLHYATGIERQQLKWFAYAVATAVSGAVLRYVLSATADVSWAWWVGLVIVTVGLVFLAIAVGIAILHYRLYEIDLIINKTLVYGLLTVTLALVYLSSVFTLNQLFIALIGEGSQLVIVASTLLIAALFNPLRRRIQGFIDRRFYRRKYDAAKTLEAYGAKLREETDLERLCEDLMAVVHETLQPAYVSLWLRPAPLPNGSKETSSEPEADYVTLRTKSAAKITPPTRPSAHGPRSRT